MPAMMTRRHRFACQVLSALAASALAGCAASPALPGAPSHSIATSALSSKRQASGPNAVVLDPLYIYPGNSQAWEPLVKAHAQTPAIPIIAIADVTSEGPGNRIDQNYVNGIGQLHAAGISVLGYVATGYGKRALGSVKSDTGHW